MATTKTTKPKNPRPTTKTRQNRAVPLPANVLPPERPHYLRAVLITIVAAVCVIIVFGIVFAANLFHGIGADCDQKVQGATRQAQEQAGELQKITLFGSKPKVSQALDDDCVDGDGTGTATAAYQANNIGFTQANGEVMRMLGGTESAVVLNDNTGDINDPSGASLAATSVDHVSAVVKASDSTSYLAQFIFATPYDCSANGNAGLCSDGSDVVQTYGLQNEPIKAVDVSVYDPNSP